MFDSGLEDHWNLRLTHHSGPVSPRGRSCVWRGSLGGGSRLHEGQWQGYHNITENMSMQFSPFSMEIEPNKNTDISVRNNLFSANLYFWRKMLIECLMLEEFEGTKLNNALNFHFRFAATGNTFTIQSLGSLCTCWAWAPRGTSRMLPTWPSFHTGRVRPVLSCCPADTWPTTRSTTPQCGHTMGETNSWTCL